MRGKISDQDLTNYALNDGLEPGERLYVESLLAVSEECRHDIYEMIDMGQLLEEGFDREAGRAETQLTELTAEQRRALLEPPRRNVVVGFLQRAASVAALAACVALCLSNPHFRSSSRPAVGAMAQVSTKVSQMVSSVGNGQDVDFASLVDFRFDDSPSWLQTASDSLPPSSSTICTPPSWPDTTLR